MFASLIRTSTVLKAAFELGSFYRVSWCPKLGRTRGYSSEKECRGGFVPWVAPWWVAMGCLRCRNLAGRPCLVAVLLLVESAATAMLLVSRRCQSLSHSSSKMTR